MRAAERRTMKATVNPPYQAKPASDSIILRFLPSLPPRTHHLLLLVVPSKSTQKAYCAREE